MIPLNLETLSLYSILKGLRIVILIFLKAFHTQVTTKIFYTRADFNGSIFALEDAILPTQNPSFLPIQKEPLVFPFMIEVIHPLASVFQVLEFGVNVIGVFEGDWSNYFFIVTLLVDSYELLGLHIETVVYLNKGIIQISFIQVWGQS
jgi:hypothetical protein